MKKSILILITVVFISCKEHKDIINIELLNDTIFCVSNLDYNKLYFKDKAYDSIYQSKSINLVRYRVSNNSDKKYLIVFDKNRFGVYNEFDNRFPEDEPRKDIGMLNFTLFLNDNKKVFGGVSDLHLYSHTFDIKTYYNCRLKCDTLKVKKLNSTYGSNDFDYVSKVNDLQSNHLVIYPNEVKYFITAINLPLRDYTSEYLPWNTKIQNGKVYKAGLILYNKKKYIEKYLSKELKQEIQENGYVIFDGLIKSNKVPVKMISLPRNWVMCQN